MSQLSRHSGGPCRAPGRGTVESWLSIGAPSAGGGIPDVGICISRARIGFEFDRERAPVARVRCRRPPRPVSFLSLYLELTFIRWAPMQVRLLAYFSIPPLRSCRRMPRSARKSPTQSEPRAPTCRRTASGVRWPWSAARGWTRTLRRRTRCPLRPSPTARHPQPSAPRPETLPATAPGASECYRSW